MKKIFIILVIVVTAANLWILRENQLKVAEVRLRDALRSIPVAEVQSMESAAHQSRFQLGELTPPEPAEEFLPVLQAALPAVADGAEIVWVSGYEPESASSGSNVEITIDRPGKTVVLLLSSYEKTVWRLLTTPGTDIQFVALNSYTSGSGVTSDVEVPVYASGMRYVYQLNEDFVRLLDDLKRTFNVDGVDAFFGRYALPPSITIDTAESLPEWQRGWSPAIDVPSDFSFELLNIDGTTSVPFTLKGPRSQSDQRVLDPARVAVSSTGDRYRIGSEGIEIESATGKREIPLPANFPEFSWPSGIAYDSDNKLVSIMAYGGEGALYRFDTVAGVWKDFRTLGYEGYNSVAYDPQAKVYVATKVHESYSIVTLDQAGVPREQHNLNDSLIGMNRYYDPGNRPAPTISLIPRGDEWAILLIRESYVEAIWYYNTSLRKVAMTYQRSHG